MQYIIAEYNIILCYSIFHLIYFIMVCHIIDPNMSTDVCDTALGDGCSDQGSGDLQPGFRPEPEIIDVRGLGRPDRLSNPFNMVEGFAPHLFEWVGKPLRTV